MKKDSYRIGYEILGPIFEGYCLKVWIASLIRQEETQILFMTRGGIQLQKFYKNFIKKYRLDDCCPHKIFYISRISAYKAGLAMQDEFSIEQIVNNNLWETIEDTFQSILPKTVFGSWWNELEPNVQLAFSENRFNKAILTAILNGKHDEKHIIRSYLNQQLELLNQQIVDLSLGRTLLLLVDTGWSGTILGSLHGIVKDRELVGLFFGKSSYGQLIKRAYYNDLIGVEIDASDYSFRHPKSAILLYRHLVESVCEVSWPSVKGFEKIDDIIASEEHGEFTTSQVDEDPILLGILDYFNQDQGALMSQSRIFSQSYNAYKKLDKLICFPNSTVLKSLMVSDRSADMGKSYSVKVLHPKASDYKQKVENLRASLWVPGQMVIEIENRFMLKSCQIAYLVFKQFKFKRLQKWIG